MAGGWGPSSTGEAYVLAILAMVCWGSWSNTCKPTAHVPFGLFYWDYSMGLFATAMLFFLTAGEREMFMSEDDRMMHVLAAVGAGVVFNVANVMLVIGIKRAGLAIAFPVGIGMALVLGTLLTYFIDKKGKPEMLFPGVALAFLAVLASAMSERAKSAATSKGEAALQIDDTAEDALLDNDSEDPEQKAQSKQKDVLLCFVAGVLMSLWSPLNAYAIGSGDDIYLTTYGAFVLFTAATVVTSIPISLLLLAYPVDDKPPSSMSEYSALKPLDHCYAFLGGLVWSIGTLSNSVSGSLLGFAASYAIGQSAPMIATMWGLFYFNEYAGANAASKMYVGLMFVLYISAIVVIAFSQ